MPSPSVGRVLHLHPRGVLVVLGTTFVRPGTLLVDSRNEPVGKVIDVVGPTKAPYLILDPRRQGKTPRVVGKEVFAARKLR